MKYFTLILFTIIWFLIGCHSRVETIKVQLIESQQYNTETGDAADLDYLMTGNRFFVEEQYDSAAVSYHKAFAVHPSDWRISFQLGKTASATGYLVPAEEYFEQALALCGHDDKVRAYIYQELGDILCKQNRIGSAKQKYLLVLQLYPDSKTAEQSLKKIEQLSKID